MSDYDVLVIGSGFGGSVTALRLTEKGYRVGVLEAGRRFTNDTLPKTSWRIRDFIWAPRLGLHGNPAHPLAQGLPDHRRCRRRRRFAELREHVVRAVAAVLRRPAMGAHHELARRTRAALRAGEEDAWCRREPDHHAERCRDATARRTVRQGRHVPHDAGRCLLRPRRQAGAGEDRSRPVLRRRRSGAHRLHPVRRVHDRLPARREEHAHHQLPRTGRERRRGGTPADDGDQRAPRWRRLRDRHGAHRQLVAPGRPHVHGRPGRVLAPAPTTPRSCCTSSGRRRCPPSRHGSAT